MGQNFDDYSGFQQIPGMPILQVKAKIADYGLTNDFTNTYQHLYQRLVLLTRTLTLALPNDKFGNAGTQVLHKT